AIFVLNGMGNMVLRGVGLRAGTGESSFHSPQELKLLVADSQEAGLLNQVQQQLAEHDMKCCDDDEGDDDGNSMRAR
ncbi:hypothetical protein ACC677_38820, partial [Rhizobium ruizarguesonis]